MKRRLTILTAVLALLAFLAIPMGMWGQSTKTEGFESASTSTTYNSTFTVNESQSDCGIGWSIYYGTVSTNGALQGSKSAQMRWYKSASSNYPYLKSTTAIDNLTNVAFKAKVGNTAVKMDVSYSTDGTNWTSLATAVTFSNTNVTDFTYSIPTGGKYIKIGVSSSSTASMGSYYALLVDNVVFTYSSNVNTYTVTYHANVTGVEDIEVEYNEGDDVTVAANTFTNPGYDFTEWNTEADGTGVSYSPNDVIEDINAAIDLYAQWEESTSTTGTIKFGSSTGHVKINAALVTGDDDINNEWTITTEGTTSFTQASTYSQVGSNNSPATSITFTTTLPEEVNVTAMEAKFGGFSNTAGTITMKVGGQTIGTGSLNATNDVVVNSNSTEIGDVLTVTVTNIAKGVKCYYISYTYEEATPDPAVATTTTINVPSGFNTDIHNGTNAGTLTATVAAEGTAISGATVTWESSNTSVATIAANGAVTLVAVGTTTITASYAGVEDQYRPSSDTYELTVTDSYAPGAQNNPYTVAQARAAIDANTGITNVYATGIISQVDSYSNNTITYWISDDGTTTNQLEVYKGKNLNNTNFTALTDVEVGATVIVFGTLKKYNEIYEFNSGNYLTSYTAPQHAVEAPTFNPVAGTYTEAQTVTISCGTSGASIYYTTDGTEPDNTSTQYTTALTISTTTTIKAVAYDGTNYSNVTTATYHFCSAEDPYTVTEALAFNEYPANNIYVSGIVSTAPTSLSSGTLTYYISADGTTTNELEVYKGKDLENANFTAVDDIQVGDIVTVYGNVVIYGTTNPIKEFAQGNYLVSFERPTAPAQEYTLTVGTLSHVNLFIFGGDESETIISTEDGETTAQVYDGTEVLVSIDVEEGYIFQSLSVMDGNGDPVEVEVLTANDLYSFVMPASNVTITATAIVAPAMTTYTLATSIESGKQYIIVGQDDGVYYAMGSDRGNNRNGVEVTVNGTTASATIDNNFVHEFTISSLGTENHYSIMDATTNGGYLYAAGSGSGKNYLKTEPSLDENGNGDWEITINSGTFSVVASGTSTNKYMRFNNAQDLFACYGSASSQHPVYFYVKDETVPVSCTLDINGYTAGSTGGYYLIASPVTVNPASIGMTDGAYDLYYFDQEQELEWINYKDQNVDGFNLEPGKGYLYAKQATTEGAIFQFTLSGTPYDGEPITLTRVENSSFSGWNLVGNPLTEIAYIADGRDFYTMNEGGTAIILVNPESKSIQPMEGIFVIATTNNETITFTTEEPDNNNGKGLVLNLNQGQKVIDRVVVRFGEGRTLSKFQIKKSCAQVYIPMEGTDYAVVRSEEVGETPVSFKAEENGTYTLSFSAMNTEFGYLHLIDNMTGNDVDLLADPNYSFEAKTTDSANRFKLVFATGQESK